MNMTKRFLAFGAALLMLCGSIITNVSAAGESYGWYCAHVGAHKQPRCGAEMNFIEDYGGYYIGNGDNKVVYLTFDAGYENGNVEKILDTLK